MVGEPTTQGSLEWSIASDVGHVRSNNEDFARAATVVRSRRQFAVWAVADGVGGGPEGERASATAVETVVEYICAKPWHDPAAALTAAFELANAAVFDITSEGRAATTLVVAVVSEWDGAVTVANIGDSRAYLVADRQARQITEDHSLVAARVAAGQMTAAEARKAPDRNLLTRAVGSERIVQVDVFGQVQLQPSERLVLCTDGVHGMIEDEAIGLLAGGVPIEASAGALVAAALAAGGLDNATALVGGFAPSPNGARGGVDRRGRVAGLRRVLPSLRMPRAGRRRAGTETGTGEHRP